MTRELQALDQAQPPMVVLAWYRLNAGTSHDGDGQSQSVQWDWQHGGSASVTPYQSMNSGWYPTCCDPYIPPDGPGYTPPVVTSDQGETFAPTWQYAEDSKTENGINYHASIRTGLMIVPGGQTEANGTALYLVQLAGKKFSSLANDPNITGLHLGGSAEGDWPMPPEWLRVNNQTVVNSGITNADGSIVGYALVSGSAGAPAPFTVTATRYYTNNDYTFNGVQATNVTVQSLTVISNSATRIDATNCVVVKTLTNDYVNVQAVLSIANDWFLTNATLQAEAGAAIQWTGGEVVPGNPLQRRVSKAVPTNITVTASLGSSSASLNVWVIWATMSFQFADANPSPLSFPSYLPGNTLGIQYYYWDLVFAHPGILTNADSANTAAGKMCGIATIAPTGAYAIITNGWDFSQMKMPHPFANGQQYIGYTNAWQEDTFTNKYKALIPDHGDRIYYLDGPPVGPFGASPQITFEQYCNFYSFVTWDGQRCSDTNNFWHFQGRWNTNQTPQISNADVNTNTIVLPTTSTF